MTCMFDIAPFESDVAYIQAEGQHLLARCKRRVVELRLSEACANVGKIGYRRRSRVRIEDDAEWSSAVQADERTRRWIDACLAATSATGTRLAIDTLAAAPFQPVERTTLLLCVLAAADPRFELALGAINESPFASVPSMDLVMDYVDADFAERVAYRQFFLPTAPLFASGILSMSRPRDGGASCLRSADIHVSEWAFDRILGIVQLGDDEFHADGQ
jgi:hypothetical protein